MIGKKIAHYKILEKLGQGGMGIVYKARDSKLDRDVAIKFLPHQIVSGEEERERFKIEARAAAALNHPNIATIYAIEEINDELFIVMEYIDGKELREIIDIPLNPPSKGDLPRSPLRRGDVREPNLLPITDILTYATQISAGLQAAHDRGIVHRDIKSSNIMVTNDSKVKIMDFGLAKLGEDFHLTASGTTLGTTPYLAPELIQGKSADKRADIWAFGVVLYELLTGELPFTGDYHQAILYAIVQENPEPVSSFRDDVPAFLETVVNRCLEKDPDQRYQTFAEILKVFREKNTDLVIGSGEKKRKLISFTSTGFQFRNKHFLVFSAFIIAALLFWLIVLPLSRKLILPEEKHLAVLPFMNVGGDPARQAFCDGLLETITSKLSSLEKLHGALWVIPTSEVIGNKIESASQARKSFGVNLAITGSLQSLGNLFRLTLNLVDAENLRQLQSSVIDVDTTRISALQEQSVARLFDMLNLEVSSADQQKLNAGGTSNSSAFELYLLGRGYLQHFEITENLDKAIRLFKQAVDIDSLYALAQAGLGEAYWRKYRALQDVRLVEKAIQAGKKAFALNPDLAPVNITLGMIHSGTGRYEEAVQDFSRALDVEPTNADAYRGLAKVYESLKRTTEAEHIYQRAIKMKPDYWPGYNALGLFYYRHARYPEAVEQFKKVIALTPDSPKGYNSLGGMYYMMKRYSDARTTFEKALSLKKTYRLCSNLGTLFYLEGKFADAARMYEEALKLNDRSYTTWGNLAAAYYWVPGKREKAKENYWRAIGMAEAQKKINPLDSDVISSLAGYYASVGEQEKALKNIQASLELAPNDAPVMYRAGTSYEILGNRNEALHWIGKALANGFALSEIERQPEMKDLLKDHRFRKLVKKMSSQKEN